MYFLNKDVKMSKIENEIYLLMNLKNHKYVLINDEISKLITELKEYNYSNKLYNEALEYLFEEEFLNIKNSNLDDYIVCSKALEKKIIVDLTKKTYEIKNVYNCIKNIANSNLVDKIFIYIEKFENIKLLENYFNKIYDISSGLTIFTKIENFEILKKFKYFNVFNIVFYVEKIESIIENKNDLLNHKISVLPRINNDLEKICIECINNNIGLIFSPFIFHEINQVVDTKLLVDSYINISMYILKYSNNYSNYIKVLNWPSIYPNIDCGFNSEYIYIDNFGIIKKCSLNGKCNNEKCKNCEYNYICNMSCTRFSDCNILKKLFKFKLLNYDEDNTINEKYNKYKEFKNEEMLFYNK